MSGRSLAARVKIVLFAAGLFSPLARTASAAPAIFLGKFDAPSFCQYNPSYPNGGAAYCLPTAAADGVAWLGEHGFDRLPARDQEEQIVHALAAKMNTSPLGGTYWPDALPALRDYLDDAYHPSRVHVEGVGREADGLFLDPDDFAWVQEKLSRPDTVVIVLRNSYLHFPWAREEEWDRYRGHALFLAGYDAPAQSVYLHDPLLGPVEPHQPVGLIECWSYGVLWSHYLMDVELTVPPTAPAGTDIQARWPDAIAFGVALTGDANHDAAVDGLDLSILANHLGQSGKSWADGDFNHDGTVDVLDVAVVANHFAPPDGPEPAAAPEPAAILFLLLGAGAAARRRRP